jgi:hypothetical protein
MTKRHGRSSPNQRGPRGRPGFDSTWTSGPIVTQTMNLEEVDVMLQNFAAQDPSNKKTMSRLVVEKFLSKVRTNAYISSIKRDKTRMHSFSPFYYYCCSICGIFLAEMRSMDRPSAKLMRITSISLCPVDFSVK